MATDNDYELIEAPATDDDYTTDPLEMAKSAGATDSNVSLDDLESILNAKKGNIRQAERDIEEQNRLSANEGIKAAGRGGVQGLTLGYGDEAIGALNSALGDETYAQARDKQRALNAAAEAAHPLAYGGAKLAGNLATSFALPGSVGSLALQGAAQGLGESEANDLSGLARDTGVGGALGLAGAGAGKVIGKAAPWVGQKLSKGAEKLAEKATGATRSIAENFKPGTGRALLDEGVVTFGAHPETIAARAEAAQNAAGEEIGRVLKEMDKAGGQINPSDIATKLTQRAQELSEIPGNEPIVKRLLAESENLLENYKQPLPVSKAEEAKRAFQGRTNYKNPDIGDQQSSKYAASAFQEGVENEAKRLAPSVRPELTDDFLKAKKTYGMMEPVIEGARARATQLNQSPLGGLLDINAGNLGTSVVGGGIGGTLGGAVGSLVGMPGAGAAAGAAIGRRVLSPRLPAMGAVTGDVIGKTLQKAPQYLGKYAPILQRAAAKSPQALAAQSFVLQSKDPEFRKLVTDLASTDKPIDADKIQEE